MTKAQALAATIKRWSTVADALVAGDVKAAKKARGKRHKLCDLCDVKAFGHTEACGCCPAKPATMRERYMSPLTINVCCVGAHVTDWLEYGQIESAVLAGWPPRRVGLLIRRALKALEKNAKDTEK